MVHRLTLDWQRNDLAILLPLMKTGCSQSLRIIMQLVSIKIGMIGQEGRDLLWNTEIAFPVPPRTLPVGECCKYLHVAHILC